MDEFWRETFRPFIAPLRAVRFSLATLLLAVFFVGSVVAVWVNREPWEIVAKVTVPELGPTRPGEDLLEVDPLSKDGQILIWRTARAHRLTIWDWHTGELVPVPFPNTELPLNVAPGADRFLTTDKDGTLRVRKIGAADPLVELPRWIAVTKAETALSYDGNRIAATGSDGSVWLYDLSAQKEVSFPPHGLGPDGVSVRFSGDGRWLMSCEWQKSDWPQSETDSAAWLQIVDCDQGALVDLPKDIRDSLSPRNSRPSEMCTFAGTSDRLFLADRYWKIGSSHLETSPGKPAGYYINGPRQVIGFRTRQQTLEIWSSDLTERKGSAAVPIKEGESICLSTSGKQLVYVTIPPLTDRPASALWSTTTGRILYVFPNDSVLLVRFLDENRVLDIDLEKGELNVWHRRRPEYAWGIVALPEFWLVPIFLTATIFSIRRDRRIGKAAAE